MRYCFFCGEGMPDDAKFCGKCGRTQDMPDTAKGAPREDATSSPEADRLATEAPSAETQPPVTMDSEVANADYCPLKWYSIVAVGLMVASSALAAILMFVSLRVADLLRFRLPAARQTLGSIESTANFGAIVSLIAAVALLVWLYRAYANLIPLTGKKTRWSPVWAIGAWFIPILNLWRPIQVMNDIWRGSTSGPALESGPWITGIWWYGNVAVMVGSKIVEKSIASAKTMVALSGTFKTVAYFSGAQIFLSLIVIWFIWRITQEQAAKASFRGLDSTGIGGAANIG